MFLEKRSERLKYLRGRKGWSQEHVSNLLGVRRSTYTHWEIDDSREIQPADMERLIEIYGTSQKFILNPSLAKDAYRAEPEQAPQAEVSYTDGVIQAEKDKRDKVEQLYKKRLQVAKAKSDAEKQALLKQIEENELEIKLLRMRLEELGGG